MGLFGATLLVVMMVVVAEAKVVVSSNTLNTTVDCTANNGQTDVKWSNIRDACIKSNNFKIITDVTIDICKEKCVEEEGINCQSIEYNSVQQKCTISEARSNSDGFTEPCHVDGWKYMEKEDTDCPYPWFRLGNQCFLHVKERRTWAAALTYCNAQACHASLAQPNNIKALNDYLRDSGYVKLPHWLGGSDLVSEGAWHWIKGNTSITTGWQAGQPDNDQIQPRDDKGQDCLTIFVKRGDNSLADTNCGEYFYFLCERLGTNLVDTGHSLVSPQNPIATSKPEVSECPELEAPSNSVIQMRGRSVGYTASFTCKPGYKLIGNKTIYCDLDGRWSDEAPQCHLVLCGFPEEIKDGHRILVNQSILLDSIVRYKCKEDFFIDGPEERKCMDDGKWSNRAPKCKSFESTWPDFWYYTVASVAVLLILIGITLLVFTFPAFIRKYLHMKSYPTSKSAESIVYAITSYDNTDC